MTALPSNPVDAILTILCIGPDDNRWNLPVVRQWRDYCDALVLAANRDEPATFTEDEVTASRVLAKVAQASHRPTPPILPPPEPVEDEGERMRRLVDLNRQNGRLL